MRLVFAGTPATAVPSLRALLDSSRHEVLAVLTRPPARSGRGRDRHVSPVHAAAAEAGLAVLAPARVGDPGFLAELAALRPDCCPVVAYGALLPPETLAVPPHGWVNLHFSLLPAWRGAAPVPHAILRGEDITGVSTFRIEEGLDTGPVFGVITETIRPADTAGDLLARLAESGAGLLAATLDGIADGSLVARAQPADGVSLAPKITTADAQVDWSAPARHVDRLVRACTPVPGAWTTWRGERLKLGPIRVGDTSDTGELAPGVLAVSKARVLVGTATEDVELGQLQPPGRKPIAAADWARGTRPAPDERFG